MDAERGLLDLTEYRHRKQMIAEEQTRAVYESAKEFCRHEPNIREIVRAKMIFTKRFAPVETDSLTEDVFSEWLLFDYKTIKGTTLFFQFLQTQALSPSQKTLGAVMMTLPWEPVSVEHESDDTLCMPLLGNHREWSRLRGNTYLKKDRIYFVRKVPLVTHEWILGPVFEAGSPDIVDTMKMRYGQRYQENGGLWRAFLKEEAPEFILTD
ncbi:hypothetical protein Q0N12_15640 [Rossellomorea marisflavi]|nr:hypothetical protein [Rossellomorea marisflavi]MCM2589638.1 hypothetical protein [Rossellomorea marisflavi]UTE74066.1 hypothetical protein M1I95_06190 [Rossellomorea marisflavi]GLI83234.1 hypothetical protein ANABIO32_09260 [Rossellomorea marisflavi]